MLPEHEQRFEKIASEFLERPAGDYAELLRRGHLRSPDGVDPDQWREEIRRKARQDKIRVITSRDGDGAFAMLNRKIPDDQAMDAMRAALNRSAVLRDLEERSTALGHELSRWLGHHDESIAFCDRSRLRGTDLHTTRSAGRSRRRGAHRPLSEPAQLSIPRFRLDHSGPGPVPGRAAAPADSGSGPIARLVAPSAQERKGCADCSFSIDSEATLVSPRVPVPMGEA